MGTASSVVRKRVTVKGMVQGIGYRWFVTEAAQRLGVSGTVRNLLDGNVEIEARGNAQAINKFLEEIRTGHRWARVSQLKAEDLPVGEDSGEFRIRGW